MDLQEDEIEFINPIFSQIYSLLINEILHKESFDFVQFMKICPQELSSVIVDLDSIENKYELHDWERRDIFPKSKKADLGIRVQQTLGSIRLKLLSDLIVSLFTDASTRESNTDKLEEAKAYLKLKKRISEKGALVIKDFDSLK